MVRESTVTVYCTVTVHLVMVSDGRGAVMVHWWYIPEVVQEHELLVYAHVSEAVMVR